MSHHRDRTTLVLRRPTRARHRLRLGLTTLLGVVICLFAAPAALAKFGAKALHIGSASGAVDYLYTAGSSVVEQGWVDRGRYYHFDVYDPSGAVRWTSACRPATKNGTVTAIYTLQSTDPPSDATGWRFRLREFTNASSCSSSTSAQHDASLYFDVAAATSYSSSPLSAQQSSFKAGATAYVQLAGVGKLKSNGSNAALGLGTWSTTWILPSGATACANASNNASDLPGSTASGQLPDRTSLPAPAMPNLRYRPSSTSGPDAWNIEANYETRPCPDFASTNQGLWTLRVQSDATHFVKLPVFSVDTAPPDTTITGGPSNVTSSTSATFTVTSSTPGSSFQCTLDGATATPCTSPQTYTGLSAGPHTFSVAATDPAGNADPTPATATWTVDTSAPAVTLVAPAAGSYTNNTTPTFSGTAETAADDSNVTVYVYAGSSPTGTPVQTLSASVQSGGAWSVSAAPVSEGTYTVQAQQTDAASNTGYSSEHLFMIDTTPPKVTLHAPANGTHTNDTMPQVSGSAGTASSDQSAVTVTVTGGGSPVQVTTSVSPSGTWSVYLPQALADGNYTVQASQRDTAGNTGSTTSHITIDTTPPQTFLDAAPTGSTSSSTATFSFHSTDTLSQAGATFQCQLDGGLWAPCSSPQTYQNLADSTHTFSVEAVDGAGNVDNMGQTTSWTINSTLPPVVLTSPGENTITSDTTPTFSGTAGTAAGDSSVQVLIYSSTNLPGSPVQTLNASVSGDGSWSATAPQLADGTYVASAQQSNGAGTATSDPHTFTVDTHAPTTTITVGPPGSAGTGAASFNFVSSEPDSTFECQLDGGAWTACTSPQDYSGLGNGTHTFQVRATDAAGNVGAPVSQSWSVNTSLPALSLTSPSDGAITNNPLLSIAGHGGTRAGDASTVTVKIYSGVSIAGTALETTVAAVSSITGAWTTHPAPDLADGTYTVYAQQDGSAGTAYTAASTFTIDTIPPTTSITSGPQGTTSATSARFAFSSSAPGSTFQCQLDGGAWMPCSSPQSYSSLAAGIHTFSVEATDPARNVDPNPPVQSWTIDPSVPVTLTSPSDGTTTNNSALTFSGAASAANGAITVEIDDAGGNAVEFLTAGAGSSWSVSASPALPDGTYTAFASQLASDGVNTVYSNVIGFTVDTTPPFVTLTTAPTGTTNSAAPTFGGSAGTAPGDGTVNVKVYSGSSASGTPARTLSGAVSGGSWSATAASLADGTYTVQAQQSDAAGNTTITATRTFTVDATPPVVTLMSGPTGASSDATPSFGGAAGTATGDSGTVKLMIYSGTSASGSPVQTLSASASSGSWTVTASSLADGTYTAQAQQSDTAGNTGSSATRRFTIDTTGPITTITSGPSGSTSSTGATFSFTSSEAGSSFQCQLDGGTSTACISPQSYTSLSQGTHIFSVRATDAAGNLDPTPPSRSWTVAQGGTTPPPGGSTPPSGGSTPPSDGSTLDTTTPGSGQTPTSTQGVLQLKLTAKSRQHLSRRRNAKAKKRTAAPLVLAARCSKTCSLTLTGKVVVTPKRKHRKRAKPRTLTVRLLVTRIAAGKVVKLTVKLTPQSRKAIVAAMGKKHRLILTASGLATAPGMRSGTATVKITLFP